MTDKDQSPTTLAEEFARATKALEYQLIDLMKEPDIDDAVRNSIRELVHYLMARQAKTAAATPQGATAAYQRGREDMRREAASVVGVAIRRVQVFGYTPALQLLDLQKAILALPQAKEPVEQRRRWRHVDRGTTYVEIARGQLQSAEPIGEGRGIVAYRSEDDGRVWFRPSSEFDDGRFVELSQAKAAETGDDVERVAQAICAANESDWARVHEREPFPQFWEGSLQTRDDYRQEARAAIAAMSDPTAAYQRGREDMRREAAEVARLHMDGVVPAYAKRGDEELRLEGQIETATEIADAILDLP